MYVVSEITGKKYDTVEDCLAAEKQFKDKEKNKIAAQSKAFEAMKDYLKIGGTLDELVKLFGNYRVSNRDYDFVNPIWKFFDE